MDAKQNPQPSLWLWVFLVSLVFGVAYYSWDETGRRLNPDHNVTVSPIELFVRRERVFRGLRKNLDSAILATHAFRLRMGALPPSQWSEDLRQEYDMHLEIVTGLRRTCEVAAREYNTQAKSLGPGTVGALGFPLYADCEVMSDPLVP